MPASNLPPSDGHSHRERYTHGYGVSSHAMATRTAQQQAAFFLPHLSSGMSVLDCGCGPGTITVGLAQAVAPGQVVGIDIAESEIEKARAHAAETNVRNIRFEVSSAYSIPYPDASFDAVLCHAALHHMKEPERALKEMQRVLRPGGIIGLRDSDSGGHILAPPSPDIEEAMAFRERLMKHNGGDSRLGRHLPGLLHQAGFVRIKASASYETWANLEGPQECGEHFAQYFESPDLASQVTELGWVDRTTLEKWASAWIEWGKRPDAFFAYALCEAIAWKA